MKHTSLVALLILSVIETKLQAKPGYPWERTDQGVKKLDYSKKGLEIGPAYFGKIQKSKYSIPNKTCDDDRAIIPFLNILYSIFFKNSKLTSKN